MKHTLGNQLSNYVSKRKVIEYNSAKGESREQEMTNKGEDQ